MARSAAAALAIALAAAWTVAADEPWQQKPPAQWTAKEVRRILEDSPWAKIITVQARWREPGAEGLETSSTVRVGKLPPGYDDSGVFARRGEEMARFVLRWSSSRTVRAALERAAALQQAPRGPAPQAGRDEYELQLLGDPMIPFPQVSAVELAQNTWLTLRSSGERYLPARVVFHRRDGRVTGVSFFFRRLTAAGRPWLTADERTVEFTCRAGRTVWKARFIPSRMRDRRGFDF